MFFYGCQKTPSDSLESSKANISWHKSTIDLPGVGEFSSLALDTNNKSHISYFDKTNRNLKYATNASGSWVTTVVDSTLNEGGSTSIKVDPLGGVHIAYLSYASGVRMLKYAFNNGGDGLSLLLMLLQGWGITVL